MDEENLLHWIYYAHEYLSELERLPRDYGTGEGLFPSEIHTVTAVAANPGINLTGLAEVLGVSKAAVSKFTTKMVKRNYIEKHRSGDNQKEVLFKATEKGKAAARGHGYFEKSTFGPLARVEENLSLEERETIISYFRKLKYVIEK